MRVMTVHLKTLSPVFIGNSEEVVMASEYVRKGDEYFRLHEDFFYTTTSQMDFATLNKPKDFKDLGHFKNLCQVQSRYRLHNCPNIQGEVKPFIRTGMDLPYIPGSSLKGALRSAYMINRISNPQQLENDLQSVINHAKFVKRTTFGKLSSSLDSRTFRGQLKNTKYHPNDPQADLFRLIKISDSSSLGKDDLQMTPVIVYTIQGNALSVKRKNPHSNQPMQINVEAIPADTLITVRVTFDEFLEKQFTRTISFEEILDGSIRFYKSIASKEKEFYNHYHINRVKDFYHHIKDKQILQVGFGSGLLGNTITSLVSKGMQCKIRNAIKHHDAPFAPKSRRLVCSNDGSPISPLGWLEVVKME
ncbi:MAG TPA: type III-A CRISPR-associated RAMP protein Csm5 [Thermotogota bacterium]|nr:type III-A CRISPR-associated RAMP protein Csm5 [Thermotogota bacterium]